MNDEQLERLWQRCSTATPMARLNRTESFVVLRWLESEGHITFTGKPIEQTPERRKHKANNPDGTPKAGS